MKILGIGYKRFPLLRKLPHLSLFTSWLLITSTAWLVIIVHSLGLLRYNPDVEEPVMLIQACELSAFGFFQRGEMQYSIMFAHLHLLISSFTHSPIHTFAHMLICSYAHLLIHSFVSFISCIGSVREMITFFNKTICKRTSPGQRQSVQNEEYYVHVFMRSDGLATTQPPLPVFLQGL